MMIWVICLIELFFEHELSFNLRIICENLRSTLSTDDTKNTDEEDDHGEGTYPVEET